MDTGILAKISKDWGVSSEKIQQYNSFFNESLKPIIKTKFLSHLVTTIEDMVNEKRMRNYLKIIETDVAEVKGLLASKTIRLYSIMLVPVALKKRATTRYHPSGAIIYYNSSYEEKNIRILIAHEIGHIINKELMENSVDTEQTANLFAYIAMVDKNKFYTEECKKFISKSDIEILNDINNTCPLK